jgi:hypothetical protein
MEDECIARDCFHPVVVVTTFGPLCEVHAKRLCLEPGGSLSPAPEPGQACAQDIERETREQ